MMLTRNIDMLKITEQDLKYVFHMIPRHPKTLGLQGYPGLWTLFIQYEIQNNHTEPVTNKVLLPWQSG